MSPRIARTMKKWWPGIPVALILIAALLVFPFGASSAKAAQTRIYYVAADEVQWDYAPSFPGTNPMTGAPYGDGLKVFLAGGPDRIGDTYLKSRYRQYTDATFTTPVPQPPYLGILGPILRAEVGDTIEVHFKNNTRFPASMHPHGVFYAKDSEGNVYNDGSAENPALNDGNVPPGGQWTYIWRVPERAGPGPRDPSSVVWPYHGHVDEPGDTNGGLIGPIIITAKGMANPDGSPKGVSTELVTLFTVFDENRSIWIDENIATRITSRKFDPESEDFAESNLMHSINGYLSGDLPGLEMKAGSSVRWYLLAMGTEVDLHTIHWHGNVALDNGQRSDVIGMLPMMSKTVDMVPDNPGIWMYHCHVNDHLEAGMMALYTVKP
ncbi:MAG: multicopper oxidase domain-containing protein [Chloroflexi bacterium]|nr:multicopper oxidase domain-containing protein [Chloroflexota bacterium]